MGESLCILSIVLIFIGVQYLLEVHVGDSTHIHDAESGTPFLDGVPQKSSPSQFLGMAAPMQLAGLGATLFAQDIFAGGVLSLLALFLFLLFRGKPLIGASPLTN